MYYVHRALIVTRQLFDEKTMWYWRYHVALVISFLQVISSIFRETIPRLQKRTQRIDILLSTCCFTSDACVFGDFPLPTPNQNIKNTYCKSFFFKEDFFPFGVNMQSKIKKTNGLSHVLYENWRCARANNFRRTVTLKQTKKYGIHVNPRAQ